MFKKILSLTLAGIILFYSGAVVFAKTSTRITQSIKFTDSSTSQTDISSGNEKVHIEGTNTDAESQTTNGISAEDENKYISWKEADKIFKSEFDDSKNYHDLFHPYVTLGGLAYRIWLTAGSPVMDDELNDFGNTWWYCAFNKIINEEILNNIVMKENRFYSLNELRITLSDFTQIIDNYKIVRAVNSTDLRQATKLHNVKTFNNNDAIQIRSKYYSYDGVIDYGVTCIIGNYCIVGKPRLPDNGEICQIPHMSKNGYIVKIHNYNDIEELLGDLNNDCLFFHNGNVYFSIDELLMEESADSPLNLFDVFYLYYGKTIENEDTIITVDYNNDSNQLDIYQNQNSINLPSLTRKGYNFDGYNICKEEIDENNNKIKFWHCTSDKDEYQWLTEETAEYKITKFNDNSTIFNIGDESISFVAQWKKCTDAEYFTYTKNEATKTVTITKYTGNDTEVVIPASIDEYSVTSIGDYAFYKCKRLTSITIPDSVIGMDNYVFKYCKSLTNINMPCNLTNIGADAFSDCTNLKFITIPDSVTHIDNYAFRNCTSLTIIDIPKNVTNIVSSVFYNCRNLTNINVDSNNKYYASVDGVLFTKDIKNLVCYPVGKSDVNYIIPSSVTSIGYATFFGCTSLSKITVDSNNEHYTSIDGVLFTKDMKTLICYPSAKINSNYIIPDSVTTIGYGAFNECTSLKNITIPNSITNIRDSAFSDCINLKNITIPNNITRIGSHMFYGCISLTSIHIPDSVIDIGTYAFYNCINLDSIYIPSSVTSIGIGAFFKCISLTSIDVDICNEYYTSLDGVLFTKGMTTLICYPASNSRTFYNIPESVTIVDQYAFSDCTNLIDITIPSGVKNISDYAFYGCTNLKSIAIPNSVISIGNYAFWSCTNLVNITIPDCVKVIGYSAFSYCTSLTKITIPDSVTSIGDYAFYGCTILISVIMPDSVTSIGYRAFYDCTNIMIFCYENSYAETYAKNNSIAYEIIT